MFNTPLAGILRKYPGLNFIPEWLNKIENFYDLEQKYDSERFLIWKNKLNYDANGLENISAEDRPLMFRLLRAFFKELIKPLFLAFTTNGATSDGMSIIECYFKLLPRRAIIRIVLPVKWKLCRLGKSSSPRRCRLLPSDFRLVNTYSGFASDEMTLILAFVAH